MKKAKKMTNKENDYVVFILTHGRPNKVKTYNTLIKHGYTGKIFIIIDNKDKTKDEYLKNFGDKIYIFDKEEIAKTFDMADNFKDMRIVTYARNASFEIAKKLDVKYFIQLDDDYVYFDYRFDNNLEYAEFSYVKNLDYIFDKIFKFYKENKSILSIALSQNGYFIGV
jgi:hypothetical protein